MGLPRTCKGLPLPSALTGIHPGKDMLKCPTKTVLEGRGSDQIGGRVQPFLAGSHGDGVPRHFKHALIIPAITYGDDLVWHPPAMGDTHLWKVLRSLAVIHPGGPPLEQILARLRTSLDQNASLAIVTANLSLQWVSALELLTRSDASIDKAG